MEGTKARTPSWAVLVTTIIVAATVVAVLVEVLVAAVLVAVVVEAQHSSSSMIPRATHHLPNTQSPPILPFTTRHLDAAMATGMVMEVAEVVVVGDIEAATEEVTGGNWQGFD